MSSVLLPSVLWHCRLGARKSIWPVKIEWWGVVVVIRLECGADCLHTVQLMSLHPKTPSSLTYIRLTALCPGLPRWAGTRKVNPIWILLEQETSSLASFKSRLVLPFWYRLTPGCPEKRQLNGCSSSSSNTLHCFAKHKVRHIVNQLSVMCVCLLVTTVSPTKTYEPIEVPFGTHITMQ